MHTLEKVKEKQAEEEAARKAAAESTAEKLRDLEVVIRTKAGEGGRLFGSITSRDIAEALKEQHDISVDKKKIQLPQPIKAMGSFDINVKLYPGVAAKLNVKVTD